MAATDRSETADRAARWAADLAAGHGAELLLCQVLPTPQSNGQPGENPDAAAVEAALGPVRERLAQLAAELAGPRGRARVSMDADPVGAIVEAADEEQVDVLVVGNAGMQGRKQFLLGNVPNRISHTARCTVVIVNTGRAEGDGGPAVAVRRAGSGNGAAPVEGQLLRRAWRIGRILVKAGARDVLAQARTGGAGSGNGASDADGADATRALAQRLRAALDELGPTFAKLGQILSTRPDLLPPAVLEELASLQEKVTPLTEAEVVAAMERELRVPWEDVFGSIAPQPLAAGTIAQVHRATLESGERVVVKVQRPTAEADIVQDLALLELFAAKAAERPALRQVFDVPAMIEHLSSSLRRELDFRREASNLRRMREVLAPFPRLAVPDVYEQYSTARLLVMQEVQGVPVRQAPPGPARQEAGRQLLEAYYRQVMVEGFFHADPHPGNMKWWQDKIYFLDLGMVGEVEPQVRQLILLLLLAFSQKDAAFLSEVVLMLAASDPRSAGTDMAAFQQDLEGLIARYRERSLREIQLGPLLQEVTQIAVRHNVRVPAALMLTGKAFSQMQLVAAELDPTLDPFSVAESFVLRNTLQEVGGRLDPKQLFYETQKVRLRLTRVLEAVEGLVGAREGSEAKLRVEFRGTEHLERAVDQAGRRLSAAIALTGALVLASRAANSPRVSRWVPAAVGGIGSTLAAILLVGRSGRRSN
jgi:predicted unusual protein kinase regulating ubiquinone biosynthesis (AarF/ABC1/UbiB family)/nucleotide-binding universal stress UspA family protein